MSERNSRDTFRDKRGTAAEQGSDEDYYPEDAYSPWKKGNVESFMSNLSKSSGLLLVIIGAGVFILVALFVFLPMLHSPTDTKPVAEMEARVKKMEAKLTEMEQNYQKVAQLALQEDKLDQVSARVDRLGASTTQRLDQMTRDLETLHKQPAPVKTDSASKQPAAPSKPEPAVKHPAPAKTESAAKSPAAPKAEPASSPKPAETPEKKASTEKYHEVKPLETLYGLGKAYGLSVDELRRLNNMSPTDTIRTGQKLKVSK
ncbi:MAG: LysM peptidoglycan-binding domain-containing protein [Deltaproteobacteria bacterium]|nr:LysM peptidoglycan-binding domain-containing protein [Deltaproteobacteria bacterium]